MEMKIIQARLNNEKLTTVLSEMLGIIAKVINTGAYIEKNCTDKEVARTGGLMKEALKEWLRYTLEYLQEDPANEKKQEEKPQAGDVNTPPLRGGFPAPSSDKTQ